MSVTIPGVLLRFLQRASIGYAGTRNRDLVPRFHYLRSLKPIKNRVPQPVIVEPTAD